MRSPKRKTLIAGLAAVTLALGGSACNDLGNDPRIADAYVQLTGITFTGTSLADMEPVVAHIVFDMNFRGDSTDLTKAQVEFGAGTFTSSFSPPGIILPNTVEFYCPSKDNEMLLTVMGAPALGGYAMSVHFDGKDNTNGRPVSFDVDLAWTVGP